MMWSVMIAVAAKQDDVAADEAGDVGGILYVDVDDHDHDHSVYDHDDSVYHHDHNGSVYHHDGSVDHHDHVIIMIHLGI